MMTFISLAGEFALDGVKFAYRVPVHSDTTARILVCFGGRNWEGDKTLRAFGFDAVADRHNLYLISPSFQEREYWEPQSWSGNLLLRAIDELRRRCSIPEGKLYLYGYSAGGQCAAHFAVWLGDGRVAAWGAHACGYYPEGKVKCPALVTCGLDDFERMMISRSYVCSHRENGGEALLKFLSGGHELQPHALELARAWLEALLGGQATPVAYGEDDTNIVVSTADALDPAYRNPLYSQEVLKIWKRE